ncbi:MAG: DUF4384 domain-containing protein [Leptospiraceae bacterium]|nr:DUF4384 domain-containing protein [Leptospiraceae bacterium]
MSFSVLLFRALPGLVLTILLVGTGCMVGYAPRKKPATSQVSEPIQPEKETKVESNEPPATKPVENPALQARKGAIAVLPFEVFNQSKGSERGVSLASRLMARLQARQQFELVDRLAMDSIQSEIVTGQSGLVDSDSAARIGRLVGARYLILGEWSPINESQAKASFRIVVAETGRLIGSGIAIGTEEAVLSQFDESLARQLSIYQSLDNPASPYSILLQMDRESHLYTMGETVQVRFEIKRHRDTAPSRVYLQLYAIDSDGKMTMIYPNRFSGVKPLDIGQKYTFPSEKDPFEWKLVPPAGTETIQAFVTTQPVDPFKAMDKMERGFPEVSERGHQPETYSGILTVLKHDEDWSADRITFTIQQP